MDGRLSNSALLRLIIPKVKKTVDGPKEPEPTCITKKISVIDLIPTEEKPKVVEEIIIPILEEVLETEPSKITDDLIEKLNRLKQLYEFDNILKGSTLGLSAYLKPAEGISRKDLSNDVLSLLSKVEAFMLTPSESLDFGLVRYDSLTRKINFYATNDTGLKRILGSVDTSKFKPNIVVDKLFNDKSNNPIANSIVTKRFLAIYNMIPNITIQEETLNILKNE